LPIGVRRADQAAARLDRRCWNRLSAGEVRTWDVLVPLHDAVMLAHALLAVIAAHEHDQRARGNDNLIPLTVNEIRHLFAKLITNTVRTSSYWLHWSSWRQRHRHRARTSHPRRRGAEIVAIRQRNEPGPPY
jgi:hypothetical protein